ncbi:MAG: thiolase family protein [Armatimonadetes bacterium]|nr:thiolase family protein [Armatimonadota bacterium]
MASVWIIGVGMTKFGKHPERPVEDLGTEAVLEAIRDAGIDPRRIEAAYCGHVFQGMVAGQRVLAQTGLAGIPLTNVEDACSSGAVAVREAALAVRAGEHDVVLALGMEHLTGRFRGALTPAEDDVETAVGMTMPAVYAMRARRHMEEFGTTRRQLALVSVKNKRNASLNPCAQFQATVSVEEVLNSRPIADPLRLYDCSPVSDGAAAAILCSDAVVRALGARKPVRLAAAALRTGEVEIGLSSMAIEPITQRTAAAAYQQAGIGPDDVDLAEVHDCFSIAEVLRVEGLGLFPVGEYPVRLERGEADIGGRLPVNPSGGLLGKGHPLGATGVAQVVELVRQLRGDAGPRQVEAAKVGLAHCRGGKAAGIEGAACTVNILVA